ncbi:6782_t:CDS:2 [Gigaspora margarita]|uniref:6782_t:CDS:1 n=1 Tax=Gigaspora margarita TaxID=4874 RepID=A0ABN7VL71_GIGMA|nr:6782_t:CDS:2 [Gigaspora margarita]
MAFSRLQEDNRHKERIYFKTKNSSIELVETLNHITKCSAFEAEWKSIEALIEETKPKAKLAHPQSLESSSEETDITGPVLD